MSARILVTGGSQGIGQALVNRLLQHGHQVVATTRHPEKQLPQTRLTWAALDLESRQSIDSFCGHRLWDTPFDAVVNNAGFGLIAPIESADDADIRAQFEANFFATMHLTQHAMAHFRKHTKGGTLMVNTSIGGRMAFPYFGYYNASKHALEAAYESLWYESANSNIHVKIIEPGFTQTQFATQGMRHSGAAHPNHREALNRLATAMKTGQTASNPDVVAAKMEQALFDGSRRLRYAAGKHAGTLLFLRKVLPDAWFQALIKKAVLST